MTDQEWYHKYVNIMMLTRYMADNGWSADEVAIAVEKPWKYEDEFHEAEKVSS